MSWILKTLAEHASVEIKEICEKHFYSARINFFMSLRCAKIFLSSAEEPYCPGDAKEEQ